MAVHPKKADAYLDLARGDSVDAVSKRYKIPRTTVLTWEKAVKAGLGVSTATAHETKKEEFVECLLEAACASVRANKIQHELLGDKDFLRNLLAREGGAAELVMVTNAILKNTIAMGKITGAFESSGDNSIVRAEIVEE